MTPARLLFAAFLSIGLNVIVFDALDAAAVAHRERYARAADMQSRNINRAAKADRLLPALTVCEGSR